MIGWSVCALRTALFDGVCAYASLVSPIQFLIQALIAAGDSVTAQHYYFFVRLLEKMRALLPIRIPLGNWHSSNTSAYYYAEDVFRSDGYQLTLRCAIPGAQSMECFAASLLNVVFW